MKFDPLTHCVSRLFRSQTLNRLQFEWMHASFSVLGWFPDLHACIVMMQKIWEIVFIRA